MPARPSLLTDLLSPLALQAFLRVYHPPTDPPERRFCYETDRFAFANETVWNYVAGEVRPQAERGAKSEKPYTRRCFVMVRAALQFLKFARFELAAPPLDEPELRRRVKQICSRHVWRPALPHGERFVLPGFANVHEISAAWPGVFQDHIGAGWPVYLRMGNFPICLPVSPAAKARLNDQLLHDLGNGYPTILWLYNFPSLSMNHTVMVYHAERDGGLIRYRVYDPNYADASKELQYDTAAQTYSFEPTYYFKGGAVTPRAIYRGFFE